MRDSVTSLSELSEAADALFETAEVLEDMLAGASAEDLTWLPPDGPWTVVQHLCHLRDLEREGFAVRIRLLLDGSSPELPDINGEKLAVERDYLRQDGRKALADFASSRKATLKTLRQLTADQLSLAGTLEGVGPVTVGKVVSMMLVHDREHLDLIDGILRRPVVRPEEPAAVA
ncbi:MAG TPA: DinB family protein [Verrucomicrobiae bacterium]|nr:DinB family protein [Verrucomicrobiae bacterium]